LTVTVTQGAVATGPGQICYQTTATPLSATHPRTPNASTAVVLPACSATVTVNCEVSSTQTKTKIVVTFKVRGGDPDFKLVVANARVLWPSTFPAGNVGVAYAAHLQSSGGKAPVHWKIASGKLPPGLTLNGSTGAITGTPKTKGTFTCEVRATDSESPPKTANIAVSITIK
jgi:large repetitive protein